MASGQTMGIGITVTGTITYGLGYRDHQNMTDACGRLNAHSPSYPTAWAGVSGKWNDAARKRNATIASWTMGGRPW